ncbi:nitrous oxide reductase accessory protein NosL [Herbaspirillum sp. HC18]|nr:nitrous oxide reductase accessory protein NosL [Herbaspirillum sp. HC18]
MKKRQIAALVLLAALAACGKEAAQVVAKEPGSETACALDGMVLKDFPGPKAQIHYAEGKPEFFCDLTELFATLLAPEQKRPVAGMFVQDMGKTSWERPEGNWIDAKSALYVVGSKKHGSMGPTFGSFAVMQDAEAFVQKEGGKILRFEQITPEMVNVHAGSAHDNKMN